jgi:outer membrane immunogenic protein
MKVLAAVAAFVCVPGVAAAQDFDGIRAEARIGYETPTVSEDGDVFKIGSAVSYGAEIGYDAKLGNRVVAGPYVAHEFSSVDLCDGSDCLGEDGTLAAGVRLGLAVSQRTLVYGKLGYARIRFTATSGSLSDSASDSGVQGPPRWICLCFPHSPSRRVFHPTRECASAAPGLCRARGPR